MARIRGTFIDSETGEGIPNSRIELTKPDGTLVAVTATDTEGEFELDNIPPGEYVLYGKSAIHMPTKLVLKGKSKLVEPGLKVELRTMKIIL